MLKSRLKRQAAAAQQAATALADIHASIVALGDDDLLDLADIFSSLSSTPLKDMAAAEMLTRNLKL